MFNVFGSGEPDGDGKEEDGGRDEVQGPDRQYKIKT